MGKYARIKSKEDKNRVLNTDLNMGLDNINLREDLTAMDVLKIFM